MSDIDQNETSSSENLIDLESSVSVSSSGELYEPSGEFDSDDSRSIHGTNEISNTDDLSKITERQVLSAYTEGLPHDTKILVKASRPNKLSECVQIALEEETSRINQKEIRKNINDYKNNRSNFKPSNNYGGILGNPFLAENRIAIDYYSSKIFQINTDPLTLSPRLETIVPIASTRPEGTALVVHSQILQEENIRLGNLVNTVKQGKILAIAINTSEELITIPPSPLNIEEIEFEKFRDTSMLIATNTNEITEDTHRIGHIREAILYQELNAEESDSLWKVISEYPDIFQLEGDSFPSTDAIQHEIHLQERAKPVNVRSYRLPYAHRQEIVREMEEHLNELTIGDAYPIPRIDEILDQLGRSRYYTTLDLVSGYHQVSIKAEDRKKQLFLLTKATMSFGECHLGHLITDKGVKPDPGKIQCVQNYPVPSNTTEIEQFLGLSGYYRRFIEGYSQTAKSLTALLNKDVPFEWSTECQRAFEMLKEKLVEAPVLRYPDFERPFILTTDASQFVIGSILSQGTWGQDRPIAYASRTLNKAEQAYSTTEKELLSILAEYQYEVIYKTGKSNTNAYALSRIMEVKVVQTRSQQHLAGSLINLKLFHKYISDSECQNYRNARVQEVTGDLFTVSEEFHLLHYVSADLKLNRGIALEFRRKFGHLQNLKLLRPKKTEVAYFQLGSRYIINLVTKDKFWQKPTLEDMYISLRNLRLFCQEFEIKNQAMPKIGCGLDQLDWPTYNYDDYQKELKQRLREAHRIARERLMKNKIKTKASYDQTSNPITIHVNDRMLIQDKTRKGKLSPKWLVANVPLGVQAESITQLPESLISLNTFSDYTGMYYEFKEHIKLTNTDWNLITFVDLSNFNSKFQLLKSTYKATAEDTSVEGRVRRSFNTSLTKLAKVLFSSKSFLDVNSILQGIKDLSMTRQSTSDLVENQTRLFQTTMSEIAKSISNISDHQQKLKENCQLLQTQANKNSMTVNTFMVKTTLLEQSIILESLLNQYAYETQNLISIINLAIHGKIHFSVLPPIKLIKELKAIQLTLPAGTQLPVEPKVQNVPEFFSISSVSILQKYFLLIFTLHFPIITVNSYDMYHPIPLPFFMKEDNAVIIEPEIDYISFSDDSEFYFTLTQQQSDSCTRLTLYTI
ncbi:hypothetical protein QTP88_019888 [Uroleucon formosanum]